MPNGVSYGGLGQPGTRITQTRGQQAETWRYVTQALIGTGALDLVLTGVLCTCLLIGWFSIPLLLCFTGILVGIIIVVFGRPYPNTGAWWIAVLLGPLGFTVGVVEGVYSRNWWTALDKGVDLVISKFAFSWYAYAAIFAVSIVLMIKFGWEPILSILVFVFCSWLLYAYIQAWQYLKWLLIPYSWPLIGFALLLAFVMVEQMLRPTVEWTVKPLTIAEIQEAGGWLALFFPGLMARPPVEPLPGRTVRTESIARNGRSQKWDDLPDDAKHREFYRAVENDASFSTQTAIKYKCRADFEHFIRPIFLAMDYAKWNDPSDVKAGLYLTDEGKDAIKQLAAPSPT